MQMDLEELLTSSQAGSHASRGQSQELKQGHQDDRDLWPEMVALIEDIQPQWVVGENVRGFINQPLGLPRTLTDLERIGYQVVTFIVQVCGLWRTPQKRQVLDCWRTSPHQAWWREAVCGAQHGSGWDIGSAETGQDAQRKRTPHHNQTARPSGEPSPVADTDSIRLEEHGHGKPTMLASEIKFWPTPTAQDGKNNGGPSQHERNTKPLNAAVNGTLSATGQNG